MVFKVINRQNIFPSNRITKKQHCFESYDWDPTPWLRQAGKLGLFNLSTIVVLTLESQMRIYSTHVEPIDKLLDTYWALYVQGATISSPGLPHHHQVAMAARRRGAEVRLWWRDGNVLARTSVSRAIWSSSQDGIARKNMMSWSRTSRQKIEQLCSVWSLDPISAGLHLSRKSIPSLKMRPRLYRRRRPPRRLLLCQRHQSLLLYDHPRFLACGVKFLRGNLVLLA